VLVETSQHHKQENFIPAGSSLLEIQRAALAASRSILLQRRQAGGQVSGNDSLSHNTPMGFLAVAGCMLLATAMSAALTSKPSKA